MRHAWRSGVRCVGDDDLAFAARLAEALTPDTGEAFSSVHYLRQRLQRVARSAPAADHGFASFLDDHPELLDGDDA